MAFVRGVMAASTAAGSSSKSPSRWLVGGGRAGRGGPPPASMTCGGVVKSGSPTPRLMTSGIVAMTSKNFRMPEGGTACTRRARGLFVGAGRVGPGSGVGGGHALGGRGRGRILERPRVGRVEPSPTFVGGDRLVGAPEAEERAFVPGPADELEPDRQSIREAAGHRY